LPRDDVDSEKQKAIVGLYQERLKKLAEIAELADFFFADTLQYDAELLLWKDATKEGTQEILEKIRELLNGVGESEWTKDNLEKILMPEAEKAGPPEKPNRGYMLWPMRAALSGKKASPGPFEIAEVLGKEKTLERIQNAIKILAYA